MLVFARSAFEGRKAARSFRVAGQHVGWFVGVGDGDGDRGPRAFVDRGPTRSLKPCFAGGAPLDGEHRGWLFAHTWGSGPGSRTRGGFPAAARIRAGPRPEISVEGPCRRPSMGARRPSIGAGPCATASHALGVAEPRRAAWPWAHAVAEVFEVRAGAPEAGSSATPFHGTRWRRLRPPRPWPGFGAKARNRSTGRPVVGPARVGRRTGVSSSAGCGDVGRRRGLVKAGIGGSLVLPGLPATGWELARRRRAPWGSVG